MNQVARRTAGCRGFVVISVVVLLAVATTLFGLWTRAAVRELRQLDLRQRELQAQRLADAGIQRGIARQAVDPSYDGETWAVAAAELGGRYPAAVQIRITLDANAGDLRVDATADYPADSIHRARCTKSIHRSNLNPASGEET